MKKIISIFVFAVLFISCSKKSSIEPVVEPTNELVGTTWERFMGTDPYVNKDVYDYLIFKNATEVEYSSKYNKTELKQITGLYKYTLDSTEVVYKIEGFNYTGVISGDTMTVMGTTGIPFSYVKVR